MGNYKADEAFLKVAKFTEEAIGSRWAKAL
jgi:hypothetical protein